MQVKCTYRPFACRACPYEATRFFKVLPLHDLKAEPQFTARCEDHLYAGWERATGYPITKEEFIISQIMKM
jgi:hypothetical protein